MAKSMVACLLALVLVGGAWGEAPPSLRGPKSPARQLQADSALCTAHPACAAADLLGNCCPAANGQDLACCGQAAGATTAPPLEASNALGAPSKVVLPARVPEDIAWWQTAQPTSTEKTSCLMQHKFGCNVIEHQLTCLGSRDARDMSATEEGLLVKGQPCVWCGGGPCHSGSKSKCEPLDYLMKGEGKAFTTFYAKNTYQVASCIDGAPEPPESVFRTPPPPTLPTLAPVPTLAPWWLPERPSSDTLNCLSPLPSGCLAAQSMGQCLHSKDGTAEASRDGLAVAGEPCVWCGGGPCFSNSSATCAPFDYAMRGEGTAYSLFLAKTIFKVASCPDRNVKLPESDFDCLADVEQGCNAIKDATSCLSSRDGAEHTHKDGLRVRGQPCVWCGGGPCTNNGWTYCEPFDWLLNGGGRAYDIFHATHVYRLAGCKNGRAAAISLHDYPDVTAGYTFNPFHKRPLVPFWVATKAEEEERTCLKPAPGGCNQLRDMASCMTSKDGRPLEKFQGMKIANEPCVWCGGIPCTTNSTSLCEPFDYVMYGEGVAFADFSAKGVYKVAGCDKGAIELPKYDYTCLAASASGCDQIWNAEECLASKDGREMTSVGALRVHNQPCVWCGGGPCHSEKTSMCEAFDYAVNGEGSAFDTFHARDSFRLAACKGGQPQAATLSNFTDFVPGYTSKPLPLPTIPPRAQWWAPPRPTEGNISCLARQAAGCSAIKDMGTCLSSRDGRSIPATAKGLKIQGEPCVWCGGTACHSNGTTYCEPFDYLMHGEGKEFGLFYAPLQFSVANCKAGIPVPEFDFSCLSGANKGCSALTTADSCLQSKDGRTNATISGLKVHDQPCMWCGGVPCHSGGPSLCEPFDFAMNGEGKAFATFHAKLSYTFAGCKNSRPAAMSHDGFAPYVQGLLPRGVDSPHPLVPSWVPERPREESLTCLAQAVSGCQAVTDMKVCLSSRDDSSVQNVKAASSVQNVKGLKVKGEPCVWCESGACTTNSSAQCLPFDYVMHGEGLAFTTFLDKASFRVANCYAPVQRPSYEYGCLKETPRGCTALTNPYDCLGSKDGRPELRINGLKVFGEPCVWCGGGLCHSGATTMCEPFDYVMNGAGRAFYNFHAKLTYRMAACKDGQPQGATLDGFDKFIPGAIPTMKPYWWITRPKPTADETACLMEHRFGCHVIKNKDTCLGSKDGRAQMQWQGLKIHGEPCVWCGGFPCQTNSTNLCEPYDFLMHGEGKVFLNFNAKTTYNVARCKDNKPLQPTEPESAGTSTVPVSVPTDESPGSSTVPVSVVTDTIPVPPVVPTEPESPDADESLGTDVDVSDSVDIGGSTGTIVTPSVPTMAPVTFAPGSKDITSLTPMSTVAPISASTGAPTIAPVTLAPASTAAPATLPPVPTVAPVTLAPASTAAPATLPPVPTMAPVTLAPASTAAPATLPPVPTIAPVTLPAVSTSAPTGDRGEEVASTTGSATLAPVTIAPTQPPGVASDDCWYLCGEKSGNCPSFCGEGKVCCRSGATDSPECSGLSLTAFTTILHHQCVDSVGSAAGGEGEGAATESVANESSSGAAGSTAGTSQPGFSVRASTSAGPVHSDSGFYVADRNSTDDDNATNSTMVVAADQGSGIPAWAWIMMALVLCLCIPLLAFLLCGKEGKKSSKKSKKAKRSARELADNSNEDSFISNEQTQPLVEANDRSASVGQGEPDIFDLIDRNHDGVITQSEFQAAMGGPTQPVPVALPGNYQAVPMMTGRPGVALAPGAVPVAGPPSSYGRMAMPRPPVGSVRMPAPVAVQANDRSASVAPGEVEIFDLVDRNHDGVITQSEFQAAMGGPTQPMPGAQPGSYQAVSMTTGRPGVALAPGAVPAGYGRMAMPQAPAGSVRMPEPMLAMPYPTNAQYSQPGARPFGP